MTKAPTAGQQLAATLRRIERIGTRTRRYRGGLDLHDLMLDNIRAATVYGCYTGDTHTVLTGAWAIYCAWMKHIGGYRIDGVLRSKIAKLSPYRLAGLLGQMVDAGVTNNGEAETFFANLKLS